MKEVIVMFTNESENNTGRPILVGTAINDLFDPDRVLIGGDDSKEGQCAIKRLAEVYQHWIEPSK